MILVFAGTGDAREYVAELAQSGEHLIVCTATAYGASLITPHKNIHSVLGEPLDAAGIVALISENGVTQVIDATHPYAREISANIRSACEKMHIPVARRGRDRFFEADADVDFAEDYETAAKMLKDTEGRILLTIGSRRLAPFVAHIALPRMVIRVLPTSRVLTECESLGFTPAQIIAAQGPFSQGFNSSIYEDYDIRHMVTKDSGSAGGVAEKVLPALERGIHIVVIKRPEEG